MTVTEPGQKLYAIRLGPHGWERWDNGIEAWIAMKPEIASAPQRVAIEYAAGHYGVRSRFVQVRG